MTDFLFQIALSNACFSLILAIVAMGVGARAKRPHVAYLLWLFVFVKLVTPPIVTIPVAMPSLIAGKGDLAAEMHLPLVSDVDVATRPATALAAQAPSPVSTIGATLSAAKPLLTFIWLLGSLFVFAWSVRRVLQFTRLLQENTEPARQQLQIAAVTIAKQLGLNTLPAILTTSAHLSPMVWWAGGKVHIVVPATLLHVMEVKEWQWILAHELAHVRRRDYLVRWLEWLACVCFWWNPVVWWAQRNLRAMEEICCDTLVLSCLKPKPRSYANSLLRAVDLLACPAIRPPAMASEINSGGSLERRFRMIVSETPHRVNSRWPRAGVLLCALVVLPLGVVSAQDYEAVANRLKAAVEAGELTGGQARTMLGTLTKADGAKKVEDADRARTYLAKVKKELGALVEAGEISKEVAVKKYEAAEKGIKQKMAAGSSGKIPTKKDHELDQAREYLAKVKKELGALVEAGEISKEVAVKKYEAAEKGIKQKMAAGSSGKIPTKKDHELDQAREYLAKVKKELGALVEAGEISKEVAVKKYEAAEKGIKQKMAAGSSGKIPTKKDHELDQAREYLAKVKKELGALVEAGEISKEVAVKKYEGAAKAIKEKMTASRSEPDSKSITPADLAQARIEIRKAVAEGKLSPEEGRAKMVAMRKMAGEKAEGADEKITRDDWEGIEKRIEGAVERGDLTREQADAKYKELRKRMAGSREK